MLARLNVFFFIEKFSPLIFTRKYLDKEILIRQKFPPNHDSHQNDSSSKWQRVPNLVSKNDSHDKHSMSFQHLQWNDFLKIEFPHGKHSSEPRGLPGHFPLQLCLFCRLSPQREKFPFDEDRGTEEKFSVCRRKLSFSRRRLFGR